MHKSMEKLKDMLCEELEEYAEKGELSAGSLEVIHKLTDTIKNLDKIERLEGEDGYSQRYMPPYMYFDGDSSYESGNSYARRRDSRGRYTRDGRMSYARGRYSRDDGKDSMIKKLEEMVEMAGSEKEREALNHCVDMLERA